MHDNSRQLRSFLRILVVGTSMVVFAFSLANHGFSVANELQPDWPGYSILLYGWMGISVGVVSWLANPALFTSWLMMSFRKTRDYAVIPAFIAMCFAFSFMLYHDLPDGAGGTSAIGNVGPGYWIWNTSIAIMLVGSVYIGLMTLEARQHGTSSSQSGRHKSTGRAS